MKTFGKFLLAAIALLLILALIPALIRSEEYSRGAKEWLVIANAPSTVPPQENRFHAQVGFRAAADADMIEYGPAWSATPTGYWRRTAANSIRPGRIPRSA